MVRVLKEQSQIKARHTKILFLWYHSCISQQGIVLTAPTVWVEKEQGIESSANNAWGIATWRGGVHHGCPALPKKLRCWSLRAATITLSPSKVINLNYWHNAQTIAETQKPWERSVDIEKNRGPFDKSNRECLYRPPWYRPPLGRSAKPDSGRAHRHPLRKEIFAD